VGAENFQAEPQKDGRRGITKLTVALSNFVKGKGKVQPRIGHVGPEVE
jgi:hypothetical protein